MKIHDGRGRPPKAEEETCSSLVRVWLTSDQLKQLQNQAAGTPLSAYVREQIVRTCQISVPCK